MPVGISSCPEGERYEADIQGCVPISPEPFQEHVVNATRWVWHPADSKWLRFDLPPEVETGGGKVGVYRKRTNILIRDLDEFA
jgi:hypothetical protein